MASQGALLVNFRKIHSVAPYNHIQNTATHSELAVGHRFCSKYVRNHLLYYTDTYFLFIIKLMFYKRKMTIFN